MLWNNNLIVNHPIGVANILFFEGDVKDLVTIQAAILHDTGIYILNTI